MHLAYYSAQPKGGHRVLKWAWFVRRIIFRGSTSGLMLIDWLAADVSSTSSDEERPWRSKTVELYFKVAMCLRK